MQGTSCLIYAQTCKPKEVRRSSDIKDGSLVTSNWFVFLSAKECKVQSIDGNDGSRLELSQQMLAKHRHLIIMFLYFCQIGKTQNFITGYELPILKDDF